MKSLFFFQLVLLQGQSIECEFLHALHQSPFSFLVCKYFKVKRHRRKGRLVKGHQTNNMYRDCAIYFSGGHLFPVPGLGSDGQIASGEDGGGNIMLFLMLPSSKLTWQWNTTIFDRKYIFRWWISRCYASLLECMLLNPLLCRRIMQNS